MCTSFDQNKQYKIFKKIYKENCQIYKDHCYYVESKDNKSSKLISLDVNFINETVFYEHKITKLKNFNTEISIEDIHTIDAIIENYDYGTPSFVEGNPSFVEGNPSFVEGNPSFVEGNPSFVEGTNIFCLNFASGDVPGGPGYKSNFSNTQEDEIMRCSMLYPCLLNSILDNFYSLYGGPSEPYYTDKVIYSPNVPVIRNSKFEFIEPIKCTFLTAAADNVARYDVESKMPVKIFNVLQAAAYSGAETLILGAWGCGEYMNNPKNISECFKNLLYGTFQNVFKKVIFAIINKDDNNFNVFNNCFKN